MTAAFKDLLAEPYIPYAQSGVCVCENKHLLGDQQHLSLLFTASNRFFGYADAVNGLRAAVKGGSRWTLPVHPEQAGNGPR